MNKTASSAPTQPRRLSIHQRIMLFFAAALSLIIIALAISNYRISSSIFIDKTIDSTQQNLVLVSEQLNLMFDNAENYAKIAIQNQTIQQTLIAASAGTDSYSDYQRYITVQNALSSLADGKSFVNAIILYDMNHRIYDSGGIDGITDVSLPYFDRFKGSAYGIAWDGTKPSNYYRDYRQAKVVSLFQRFNSQMSGAQLGILQLSIDEPSISRQYANVRLGDTGQLFIVGPDGEIISHPDSNYLNTSIRDQPYYSIISQRQEGKTFLMNGKRYLAVSRPYERMNWTIVGIVPIEEITKDKSVLTARFTALGFCFVLFALALTPMLSKYAMRPLKVIRETVKKVQRGDLDVTLNLHSRDEIGQLAVEFNRMVSRTKSLMLRSVEEEKRRKELELAAIQAQINPHFLYNTLESICGLAELGRNDDIIDLVNQLAGFYRGVLSKGSPIIAMEEELLMTQRYLDILKVRYADKLEYRFDVDPSMLQYRTLKLLLQPIVENSIYHGLKNKRGKGRIELTGRIEQERMIIAVEDNGMGMPPETIQSIFSARNGPDAKSFGLKSTDERIKLYFGQEYGVEIRSVPGEGTRVTITLPTRQAGRLTE
ncbi:sensor histidine kinase [Cohnella sp. AR92]|uniref:sensor histidine kinase n=1 Tax=Cohnella sp. AR92 TaxID=648716 RepID=UPI000F8ECC5B|nr:sensor histidine kinase [Cohnella sp. AR92]RUS47484.1 sensor histidine kinase [Cohnella sp. AR92]